MDEIDKHLRKYLKKHGFKYPGIDELADEPADPPTIAALCTFCENHAIAWCYNCPRAMCKNHVHLMQDGHYYCPYCSGEGSDL